MKNIKTILVVIVLFAIVGAVSYSYFSVTLSYDDEATTEKRTTLVQTDQFDVDFVTSQYVNNPGMLLISADKVVEQSEKSLFTVSKLPGKTYDIQYMFYLSDFTISSNLKSNDFRWDLLENGVSIASGSFVDAVSGENFYLNSSPIVLTSNSASYELRIWLQETDRNQTELLNGIFGGKVSLDAYTVQRSN